VGGDFKRGPVPRQRSVNAQARVRQVDVFKAQNYKAQSGFVCWCAKNCSAGLHLGTSLCRAPYSRKLGVDTDKRGASHSVEKRWEDGRKIPTVDVHHANVCRCASCRLGSCGGGCSACGCCSVRGGCSVRVGTCPRAGCGKRGGWSVRGGWSARGFYRVRGSCRVCACNAKCNQCVSSQGVCWPPTQWACFGHRC
jgi:hypothetical protein